MRFGLSGAIAHRYNHVLIAICLKLFIPPCPVLSQRVLDYETTSGCGQTLFVNDLDIFQLEAFPRQDLTSVKDRCINEFQGHNGKKLKIYVDEIKIGSCGIFVNIYDGDQEMHNNPRWSLGCRGAGRTVYESFSNNVVVRLDKPVSDSTNLYSFRIYITNEFGPEIDLTRPPSMSDGPSSGVVVGIAIGAGLVVVVVIVIVAVVCWRYMRIKEKAPKKGPAVFTTTSTRQDSVRFENSPGRSRNTNHSSRGTSDLSSTTSGVRSTFSSQRQRSTQPHVNNGYVSSNESSVTNKRVSLQPGSAKEDGKKFVKESATNGKSKKSDYYKDGTDSIQKIPVSKPSTMEKIRPVERTISQKRTNTRKNTDTYHMDSSSDDSSSQSDKLLKQNDKYSNRQNKSTSHHSSYRESQSSQARRELQGSTKSRNNYPDRDQHDSRQESRKPHRTESYSRGTHRKQDQNYSDYDSDHRSHRQESHGIRHLEHDRDSHKRRYQSDSRYNSDYDSDRPGRSRDHHRREYADRNYSDYDSDRPGRSRGHHRKKYSDRNYNDYDSDRAGRSRGNHRKEYSDRNYSDYDSDHGRRRDSSRRRRNRSTDNNYRNYDSDTDRRSSRRLSHRQDRRDRYHSDEDIVDSRRQRNGSLSRRSRSNSQNYSRNNRR